MLQALKLDARTATPPRTQEPDDPRIGWESSFAAFLAQAGWLPSLPAPTPSTIPHEAPTSAKSSSEAVEPTAPRSDATTVPAKPEVSPSEGVPTDPPSSERPTSAAPPSDPSNAKATASPTATSPETVLEPGRPQVQNPSTPLSLPSPSMTTPAPSPQPQGARMAVSSTPILGSQPSPSQSSGAAPAFHAGPLTPSAGFPVEVGPPLLQEFLTQPRPPLEVPIPLRETSKAPSPAPNEASMPHRTETSSSPAPSEAPSVPQATTGLAGMMLSRTSIPLRDTPGRPGPAPLPIQANFTVRGTTTPGTPRLPTTAHPHPAALQLEGSIRWMLQHRSRGAELQLHPESLGRLTIRLTVEGSEVHARVWVSEAGTLPLLHEHRALLDQSLREQGLSLGSFELNQGGRGDASQEPEASRTPAPQPPKALGADSESTATATTPSLLLPSGAHVIEVFA